LFFYLPREQGATEEHEGQPVIAMTWGLRVPSAQLHYRRIRGTVPMKELIPSIREFDGSAVTSLHPIGKIHLGD
jgi:hypothetical protein